MRGSARARSRRPAASAGWLGVIVLTRCIVCARAQPAPGGERWVMTAERFLAADAAAPPLDEEEIREAVWELLFSRAPPALVRVVGKQVYHR